METRLKLLPLLFAVVIAFSVSSCGDDDPEESCDKFPESIGSCSADDIAACCDDDKNCYYTYKGGDKHYSENELITLCSSGSSINISEVQIKLDAFTSQLIHEARAAAICQ